MAKRGRPSKGWAEESKRYLQSFRVTLRGWEKKAPKGYKYTGPKGGSLSMETIKEKVIIDIYSTGRLDREKAKIYGFLGDPVEIKLSPYWTEELKRVATEQLKSLTQVEIDVILGPSRDFDIYLDKIGTKVYKSQNIRAERLADARLNMDDLFNAIAAAIQKPEDIYDMFYKISQSIDELEYSEKYRAIYDEEYTESDLISKI